MKNLVKLSVAAILILMVQSCKKPTACITSSNWVEVNQPIQLNSCSIDSKDFEWNFGDGSKAFGSSTSHVYTQIGDYSVELKAKKGNKTDQELKSINVVGPNYKFNGTYNVVENCGGGDFNYQNSIESIGDYQIKINNFLGLGWTVYGTVNGNNFQLTPQNALQYLGQYYDFNGGSGYINGNTITMNYAIDDINYANIDGWIDCGATLTK